jgi:hypothetical protein
MSWKHINKYICYLRGRYIFNTVNQYISYNKVGHLTHNKTRML